VHTSYTDGDFTPAQYVDFAKKAGARTVVFLEHIRRQPTYDVERFAAEVERARRESVQTLLGFEAKLLPDGILDIDDDSVKRAAVIGMAEHAFPNDPTLLREAVMKAIERYLPRWPRTTFAWVHPGLCVREHHWDSDANEDFLRMLTKASEAGVLIEHNLRYGLPPSETVAKLPASSLVTGADAHSLADLERWAIKAARITSTTLSEGANEPSLQAQT
jgi:histidinol phosphatase-like PHP family hydrolase